MASPEQPFDERELRYFLAEILKVSTIAPYDLFTLIQARGIRRSVSACTKAYSLFQSLPATTIAPHQPLGSYEQPPPAAKPKKKRPHPSEGSPTIADRTLQPQLSNFPSVNAPSDPVAFQTAPSTTSGEPPRKKRGRPSKEEFDKRVAEAAQRGEVYPPPRKRKTPRSSAEGVPGATMANPAMAQAGTTGEGSAGKKRARQPNPVPAESNPDPEVTESKLAPDATERNVALEATASAADRMQIDTEGAVPSPIPETQATEFPAQESLLAGMREHAAREAPEIMQSSSTLKEGSAPRSEWGPQSRTLNPATTTATTTE
ncbi:hypothetical protein OEA41_008762 [Lepraria neglecta]|uniref:Uncharacterized protein n=1 Tax=Lepraria neglecta TaxID=209136 RepID=A0AAD9Z0B5_9LECA|nr:hypothetical protein OEA41_008762 [Lepraria neglecta]